jgi:hypothetical protein
MEHFVGPAGANGIGVYDAQIGVALCSNLDHWVLRVDGTFGST